MHSPLAQSHKRARKAIKGPVPTTLRPTQTYKQTGVHKIVRTFAVALASRLTQTKQIPRTTVVTVLQHIANV